MTPNPLYPEVREEKDEQSDSTLYRFVDEKISDGSGLETKSDSALKPAALDNPFWN
jgi:hypothetical protein